MRSTELLGLERQTDKCVLAFCRTFPHPKKSHAVTRCKVSPRAPSLNPDWADKKMSVFTPCEVWCKARPPFYRERSSSALVVLQALYRGALSGKAAANIFLQPFSTNWGVCRRFAACPPWLTVRSVGLQFGVHVMTVKSCVTVDLLQSLCAYRWIYL